MAEWKFDQRRVSQPFSPGELVRRLESVLRRVSTADPVKADARREQEQQKSDGAGPAHPDR